MGVVYKALHTKLKRLVVLKVLPEELMSHPQAISLFNREMETVGKLDHPHIIRATDAGEADGRHFLVLEYVEGMDLGRVVNFCQPLSIADACELCRQAALGLQFIYENGLIHRDIKPSNLWLTTAGEVKILDLGLACLQTSLDDEEMTGSPAQIVGTVDYMAPEQTIDPNQIDIRADLYSLGCTLYKLLTGKAPFTGLAFVSPVKKLLAHAQVPVPPICEHRSDAEGGLSALVDRLAGQVPQGPVCRTGGCGRCPGTVHCWSRPGA